MDWRKVVGALVLIAGAVIWTRWAVALEWTGKLPGEERAGRLSISAMGWFIAWGLWHRLDQHVNALHLRHRRSRDMVGAVDPRHSDAPLPVGTRVDLGPCPSCGGGPTVVIPSAPGVVEVRCRECGLIAAPAELQPAARSDRAR